MFKKGQSGNPKGKPKGALNVNTRAIKEVFLTVFNELQKHPTANLLDWAIENPTEFYKISGKAITDAVSVEINVIKEGCEISDFLKLRQENRSKIESEIIAEDVDFIEDSEDTNNLLSE